MPKLFNQLGFTLTEVLIVISITVLIIVVICSAFVFNQRAYRDGEMAAEILQNGRVVSERMVREIRQAKEIVTVLPEEKIDPAQEVLFQDGHLPLISETDLAQEGNTSTITLSLSSSDINDYYKDIFIKITGGTGAGQIRKINSYNGQTKVAQLEGSWEIIPVSGSTYKIDSSYYYIHYYRDESNNIWRRIIAYYFFGDSNTFVPWNAIPPQDQTIQTQILENPRVIGEYVTNLEFWGIRLINISLTLEKQEKQVDFSTKVFGRNL